MLGSAFYRGVNKATLCYLKVSGNRVSCHAKVDGKAVSFGLLEAKIFCTQVKRYKVSQLVLNQLQEEKVDTIAYREFSNRVERDLKEGKSKVTKVVLK